MRGVRGVRELIWRCGLDVRWVRMWRIRRVRVRRREGDGPGASPGWAGDHLLAT